MKRLLKYPPVEDIAVIVEHGLALTKPNATAIPLLAPKPAQTATEPVVHKVTPKPQSKVSIYKDVDQSITPIITVY